MGRRSNPWATPAWAMSLIFDINIVSSIAQCLQTASLPLGLDNCCSYVCLCVSNPWCTHEQWLEYACVFTFDLKGADACKSCEFILVAEWDSII